MPDEQRLVAVRQEVERLTGESTYKRLRPVLNRILEAVEAQLLEPIAAEAVLHDFRSELQQGGDPGRLVEQVAAGNFQPNWQVGMVNQPNRDLIMATFNLVIDKRELPTRTVPVPIVPVVMTSKEAQDLVSGAAFTGVASGLRADFQRLNSELLSAGITGWNANYGARREHWLPIGSQSGLSLDAEINAAVNQHNAAAALEKPLHAEFYDLPALVAPASRAALRRLRRQGCIVIIDTISIRHPLLLRGLQQSLLDTSAQTAVLTLAPHPNALTLTKSMTFTLELALRESELAARAGDPPYWCDELSAVEQFPRWFLKTLAAVFPSARPEPILSKALPS